MDVNAILIVDNGIVICVMLILNPLSVSFWRHYSCDGRSNTHV